MFRWQEYLVAVLLASTLPASIMTARAEAPDVDFYTTYALFADNSYVTYSVCGLVAQAAGCYSSGQLGPFGRVGCLIEGDATVNDNIVTRAIYVVDVNSGPSGRGVTLYRYLKMDTVTISEDFATVQLTNTIPLPSLVDIYIAVNNGYTFI